MKNHLHAVAALALCGLLSGPSTDAQTVTPAQWLTNQPKPAFKAGHTLPRLTRYGWSMPLDVRVKLCEDWGYALELGRAVGLGAPVYDGVTHDTAWRLNDPNSDTSQMAALTKANPTRYPLSVEITKRMPTEAEAPAGSYARNSSGQTLYSGVQQQPDGTSIPAGPVWSLEAPQATWDLCTEYRVSGLRELQTRGIPVSYILNGGEYGIEFWYNDHTYWEQDSRYNTAVAQSPWGQGLFLEYCSAAEASTEHIIAKGVKTQVPQRALYVPYTAGGRTERNRYYAIDEYGGFWEHSRGQGDLPSKESYYRSNGDGFVTTSSGGRRDMLTQALNAKALEIQTGNPLSYDWISAGWDRGDPAVYVADMNRWAGLLKCFYTAGMIGCNVGDYEGPGSLPGGYSETNGSHAGYEASFSSASPPNFLKHQVASSHIHALFSQVESIVRNSDLLAGPNPHQMSSDVPAYEFPTGEGENSRVLARKHRTDATWLITAWAATGADRNISVYIPELGQITLQARSVGSVYTATLANGNVTLTRIDNEGATYTAVANGTPVVTPVNAASAPVVNLSKALINGNFENPVVTGYRYTSMGTGWVFANSAVIAANGSAFGAPNAPSGSQIAVLQGAGHKPGVMARHVNFDAGTYSVRLQAARRAGQIQPIKFSIDGTQIGGLITPTSDAFTSYTTPSFTFTTAGVHNVRFEATDATGDKSTFIDAVSIFKAGSSTIKVEAEDYDAMNGIIVTSTTDTVGGKSVGYTDPGDWMTYSVGLPNAGIYNIEFRVATINSDSKFALKSGSTTLATVDVPNTGAWENWTTVVVPNLTLTEMQTLRVDVVGSAFNFNWIQFTPVGPAASSKIEAENYSAMNGILTTASGDAGGTDCVGWVDTGDWMDYSVTVSSAGSYNIAFRVASPNVGRQLQLQSGASTLATVDIPNTGDWYAWQTVTVSNVTLAAGTQTLRVYASTGGWNLNWLQITPVAAAVSFSGGSFETPAVNGYLHNPIGSGWSFISDAIIQANGSAWGAASAPAGIQTAVLQGSPGRLGSISQESTYAAGTYTVSFQAARRGGQIQPIKVSIDGTQVGGLISATSTAFEVYYTAPFTVTAGNHTLKLEATDGADDKSVFIDDVQLNTALGSLNSSIGTVNPVGSGTLSGAGVYTITGSGLGITGTADKGHLYYDKLTGNGSIVAKVLSVQNTNASAKAGIMIRETTATGSKNVFLAFTPNGTVNFQRRTTLNGTTTNTTAVAAIPSWLKLTRVGNTFQAYRSTNGTTWVAVGAAVTNAMTSDVLIGLGVSSNTSTTACTATFSNVTLTGAITRL